MRKRCFWSFIFIVLINVMLFPEYVKALGGRQNIYVIWNCDGSVCISDPIDVEQGVEGPGGVNQYRTNYIKSSDVKDSVKNKVIDPSEVTDNSNGENWCIYSDSSVVATIRSNYDNWHDLDVARHEDAINSGIDPTGGNSGNNSLAHNGDREFRAVIYDESKYESITFNVDRGSYTYYLGMWDPVFSNPTYDISSTTKENPAEYKTYLLENNLKFSAGEKNKEEIVSIKALDVPNKALSITKTEEEYTIKFNSNYYSEVTFEITGANGGKYYLKVNRSFLGVKDNMDEVRSSGASPVVYAEFIYPSTTTYNDYDVIATITTKSGTIKTQKLTAVELTDWDDSLPGVQSTKMVWNAGVNLNSTGYKIDVDSNTKDIEVTVTRKDATKSASYGGTFGGYSKGVKLGVSRFLNNVFNA